MPFPTDPKVLETGEAIVKTLHEIFGPHPGFRPAHAKGVLLSGTFQPSAKAGELSSAYHLNNPVSVVARFSSSTGLPELPDNDANGNPRGLAVRFNLPDDADGKRVHTDIVAHSANGFPARTGEEFLAFFQALKAGKIAEFLGSHPAALAFVQLPKPFPASLAEEQYFAVNAFKLLKASESTTVRYRFVPKAGTKYLAEDEVKAKPAGYLFDALPSHLPIVFSLVAQVAEAGDVTDDSTVQWPDSRKLVELGTVTLDAVADAGKQAAEQKHIIFDPVPRVDGVAPSDDPLLDVRAAVYLGSGKERRAA